MDNVRIVAEGRADLLGEGPLYSTRENALYWTDILGQRLNRLLLLDESVASWVMPEALGWVVERRSSGLIAGFASGVASLTLEPLSIDMIAQPEADKPELRLNDAKVDRQGRIWFGSMPWTCDQPEGSLYRLDTDHSVTRMDSGYCVTNGPAISADGQWLYHTDSPLGRIYRFALHEDGTLGPRSLFIQFDDDWGKPDGMTFDAEGCLWVACWGGSRIMRFARDGKAERSIALPASQITSCAFAGPDLDRMFVTSAADGVNEAAGGALFEIQAGVRGLAPEMFGG
jgi:xylono-1,5-lactonase